MYKIQKNNSEILCDYDQIITDPDEELFRWCERKSSEIVKHLGKGHRENIYHKAFEVELRNNNIPYESEVVIPIIYKYNQIGYGRADIIINKQLILEFKTVSKKIGIQEVRQIKNYMEFTGINKGILINFSRSNGINDSRIDFIYCNENSYITPS